MSHSVELDDLLSNEQTAALLGIKGNTLEIWRHKGKGPPFIKLGNTPQAPVRYLRSEVMEWLASQSFTNTSAYTDAGLANLKLQKRHPMLVSET